jgi:glutathione S-transferase
MADAHIVNNNEDDNDADKMIKLYSMPSAGNSYKVRLLLVKLAIPFDHIAVEFNFSNSNSNNNDNSEALQTVPHQLTTLTPDIRTINPTGKVPLIEFVSNNNDELQPSQYLSESNAILHYFAEGTRFMPQDKLERARAYQWMFFEQNNHEPSVCVRMVTFEYPHRPMGRSPQRMEALLQSGNAALDAMEVQLQKTAFLAGGRTMSMADICLYAYTHRAERGGFDVSWKGRPGIAAWLERVAGDTGHVPIEWLPPPLLSSSET